MLIETMNKESKRVLFSYWDGGTGHLTRTMSMAREARERGFEVGFISSEKYAGWISSDSPDYVIYTVGNRNPKAQPPPYPFPVYSHTFGHAQRLRGLRFDDTDWLEETVKKEIEVLKEFKPNIVINDYRDTIKMGAEVLGIPIVGITKSTGNPDGYTFGWWITPPHDLVLPDCRKSFNEARKRYGLLPIEDEREMFTGNISVIPSVKEIDPLIGISENSYYAGLLSHWWRQEGEFQSIPHNIPKVFSYIGEKSRPQYGYELILSRAIESLPDVGFYIAGSPEKYTYPRLDKPKVEKRVIVRDYIPARKAIPECSAILSHGGSGTVLLALSYGVPIICVGPFNSEQLTFFRWVEKQQAGLIIPHSENPLERRKAPDLGEGVEIMGHWESEISSDQIVTAINEVTSNPKYSENAQRLANSIRALRGEGDVLDLAESLF